MTAKDSGFEMETTLSVTHCQRRERRLHSLLQAWLLRKDMALGSWERRDGKLTVMLHAQPVFFAPVERRCDLSWRRELAALEGGGVRVLEDGVTE